MTHDLSTRPQGQASSLLQDRPLKTFKKHVEAHSKGPLEGPFKKVKVPPIQNTKQDSDQEEDIEDPVVLGVATLPHVPRCESNEEGIEVPADLNVPQVSQEILL